MTLLTSCFHEDKLPVLSRFINEEGRQVIYKIDHLNFTDQNNQTFNETHVDNSVYIANFFFTRCPSICPKMKSGLINIAKDFEKDHDFKIVSISIDPKYDTVEILNKYGRTTGIDSRKWVFVTGNENNLSNAANLFRTSFSEKENTIDFYHSSFVALVDKQKHIRGFYDLLEPTSVNQLKRDIRILLK
ncbi:SCO family protein [Seonamhaeicola sediminis]|uniref:SCO family protein n=1 Tax=Seonamhaeicola sediminis TaxID=2528206 RepID=A0A562YBQ5_9FLAO|nr:SCO family protein [Seonamhaeicola sediminis]TWO31814.1 SCO family protein [Seonamhaeicola sediminis]